MEAYPVTLLCEVMAVSRSGFYAYLKRCSSGTGKRPDDAALKDRIKQIFDLSRGSYGSRRIMHQLRSEGYLVGRFKVRRIMSDMGLIAKTPKRFKLTTDSRHSLPVAANVLDRKFDVADPNTVWSADISYVWTFEGWLYLAIVMDLYSRQIVGWAMDKRMKKQLVIDALSMAYWQRKPPKGLLHHSDRGSQYASHDYRNLLQSYGMKASMSRKGNCWDNSPIERFFRSLKSERLTACRFHTRNHAKSEVLDYISYYNGIRLHSTLGYLAPIVYEKERYLKAA
jgi:transposase InsO family protein